MQEDVKNGYRSDDSYKTFKEKSIQCPAQKHFTLKALYFLEICYVTFTDEMM